jgi:hypothetical protein
MQTIRLRVNDSIFQQLMGFLKHFNKNEIEVISENEEYLSIQEYLKKELENIEHGTAEFISFSQLDEKLESTIRKYEDKNT